MKRSTLLTSLLALATLAALYWGSTWLTRPSTPPPLSESQRWEAVCWPSHVGLKSWSDPAWGGAWAPRGFPHGTAWVTGYQPIIQGRKIEIRSLGIEDERGMVTVYVEVEGELSGVYTGEVRPNSFPGVTKGTDPRVPTDDDRRDYAALVERIEKPGMIQAGEKEKLFTMPSLGAKSKKQ